MKPKRTILCVDDNEQSLSIRKVMLETRGYRVITCNGGEQALEIFKKGGIDLVLTDLIMPGLDGTKLVEQVKSISPQTPAILLSGKSRSTIAIPKQTFSFPRECTRQSSCWNAYVCCWSASAAPSGRRPATALPRRPAPPEQPQINPLPFRVISITDDRVYRSSRSHQNLSRGQGGGARVARHFIQRAKGRVCEHRRPFRERQIDFVLSSWRFDAG